MATPSVASQCSNVFQATVSSQSRLQSYVRAVSRNLDQDKASAEKMGAALGRWMIVEADGNTKLLHELVALTVQTADAHPTAHYEGLFDQLLASTENSRGYFEIIEVFLTENQLSTAQRLAVVDHLIAKLEDMDVRGHEETRIQLLLHRASSSLQAQLKMSERNGALAQAEASLRTYLSHTKFDFHSARQAQRVGEDLARELYLRSRQDQATPLADSVYAHLLNIILVNVHIQKHPIRFFNAMLGEKAHLIYERMSPSDQASIRSSLKLAEAKNRVSFVDPSRRPFGRTP